MPSSSRLLPTLLHVSGGQELLRQEQSHQVTWEVSLALATTH
jgi:hypothetical protein